MERDAKSIFHAAIAHGIHVYIPAANKNYFIGSRLVCSKCGEPWYMNFTECFCCGAPNPFLYRCDNCGSFNSITGATFKCVNCEKEGTLHQECPNPVCITNTDKSIHIAVNAQGGVFARNSGFRTSSQYCLNCGSHSHVYQVRKISVFTLASTKVKKDELRLDDQDLLPLCSYIIFRILKIDRIAYSTMRLSEFLDSENTFDIVNLYTDFGEVIGQIFKLDKTDERTSQTQQPVV